MLALASVVVACAAKPPFWSVLDNRFEEVQERPQRAEFVGRWRSPRDSLVFLPNGKFTAGSQSGCWDVGKETSGVPYILFVCGARTMGRGKG